jgi:autotransporter-associated beta strand protein
VKSGSGTWTISGSNSYSGPTTVSAGTLVIASPESLGGKTEVTIASIAKLALNFKGEVSVAKLIIDGKTLPSGKYGANNTPQLAGAGVLKIP